MKKKALMALLVLTLAFTSLAGCGATEEQEDTKTESSRDRKSRDKDKDEDIDEDRDYNKESEGYESSEQVIKGFWKGMKNVDEDEIASCFYSLADAEDDIEDNYQLAKKLLNYTTIHTQEIDIELEDDGDDAEDLVSEYGYRNYDAAEIYTVTVPLTQEIDDITYEVNGSNVEVKLQLKDVERPLDFDMNHD